MKIAFITHSDGTGGAELSAATCMQYLIDNKLLLPEDCRLVCPKYLIKRFVKVSTPENDRYYQIKNNIETSYWYLPFGLVYRGASGKILSKVYSMSMMILSRISFLLVHNRQLKDVDIVHLNSLTLWSIIPFLPVRIKTVIHIRETVNNTLESRIAVWAINKYADSIIAIDSECARPFPRSSIIPNPIDMTEAIDLRKQSTEIKEKWGISQDKMVVSLIGSISAAKGYDFFLVLANRIENKNIVFLIAGTEPHTHEYTDALKKCRNVILAGQHHDISPLYAISDAIIRCEWYLPLGRTVWEGIYSGAVALLPFNETDDLEPIKPMIGKQIILYNASDINDCIMKLEYIQTTLPLSDARWFVSSNIRESSVLLKKELTG
jgi:hypothetical protein